MNMIETLKRQFLGRGGKLRERSLVVELLTSDGQLPTESSVCGALGFETQTGETLVFEARAVVLATGGTGYLDVTGDGKAQAFRAGAEVQSMEFARVASLNLARKYSYSSLIPLQRAGWILRNARGERFMERYYPAAKENVGRVGLIPAMAAEYLEGNGPIYMDLTHLSPKDLERLRYVGEAPSWKYALRQIEKEEGCDLSRQLIEFHVHSGLIDTQIGGIRNNIYGEANLPGLYAAGEAGGYPGHGASHYVSGINLATCCVSGYRAGEYAACYALNNRDGLISHVQVQELTERALKPLKMEKGLKPNQLLMETQRFLSPWDISIFRTKQGLTRVLSKMEEWEDSAASLVASDWHELARVHKVKNYLTIIKIFLMSALLREESRGFQLRLDHPYTDDINWLKLTILKAEPKIIRQRLERISIYRYPVKPEKYERRGLSFPLPKIAL